MAIAGEKKCERKSYTFLRKELPVRIANIMQELNLLPTNLLQMPSISLVQSWYEKSFAEILEFENRDEKSDEILQNFCESLIRIRNRHSNVVPTMAQGIIELKETHPVDSNTENCIQYFLNRFYMCRISIRMLINQHACLFGAEIPGHPRHIGCVDPNCDVHNLLIDAYENAKYLCDEYYLNSPDLVVEQINASGPQSSPMSIVAVPSHIHHILFELFKNAMRAVVEHSADRGNDNIPPIRVTLCKGKEDISIKVRRDFFLGPAKANLVCLRPYY